MNAEQIVTIITNILTSSGVAVFLWFLIRGLKNQIGSLNKTIETQNKTLEVMEKRISETEKVGDIYRNLLDKLPDDIDKYKTLLNKIKDETIADLESAVQEKDEKLKNLKEIEIKLLEIQEQALAEIPALKDELAKTQEAIVERFKSLNYYLLISSSIERDLFLRETNFGIWKDDYLDKINLLIRQWHIPHPILEADKRLEKSNQNDEKSENEDNNSDENK